MESTWAADELESQPLSRIRELAFLDYNTPNDSWLNTISYLCELNREVKAFFLARYPIWMLSASPSAFSPDELTTIATKILDQLAVDKLFVIDDPRVVVRKLTRFVTPAVQERLVLDLASTDDIRKGNALVLLGMLKRIPDIGIVVQTVKDRTNAARYCGIVAVTNAGTPALVSELLEGLDRNDPMYINVLDAVGAIVDEGQLSTIFPLIFGANAILSATYSPARCRNSSSVAKGISGVILRSRLGLSETMARAPRRFKSSRPEQSSSSLLTRNSLDFRAELSERFAARKGAPPARSLFKCGTRRAGCILEIKPARQ